MFVDTVTLELGGGEVLKATSWNIRQSILAQPGEFEVTLGQGKTLKTLLEMFPPNTPFQLSINGNLRMTGRTDGYRASGDATELTIFGRDALAPIHDAHVTGDKSFNDDTYTSLVHKVLSECGLGNTKLSATGNNINRKLMSGVPIKELAPARTIDQILADTSPADKGSTTHAGNAKALQAKLGEKWFEFLRKQLDRAGLMLWATGDGNFVLSAPNVEQFPMAQLVRQRGALRNKVNVIRADLLNDTRPRFTFAIVYGKSGGKKFGRATSKGSASDAEMVKLGFGNAIEIARRGGRSGASRLMPARTIDEILASEAKNAAKGSSTKGKTIPGNSRALVIRDAICTNEAQAAYLAARKLAEARRHGYQLVYTVAGLSIESPLGGRGVWTPDTMVSVFDEEFGISDSFWVESVEFARRPQSNTTIHLMRPEDVLFGAAEF